MIRVPIESPLLRQLPSAFPLELLLALQVPLKHLLLKQFQLRLPQRFVASSSQIYMHPFSIIVELIKERKS